jgi:hypothetical protein
MMSSVKMLWLMVSRKRALSAPELDNMFNGARLVSRRSRILAGLSWLILVIGFLCFGAVTGEYVTTFIKHQTRLGEVIASTSHVQIFGVLAFCVVSVVGLASMATGAIVWISLMRRLGVSENLIMAIMLHGPTFSVSHRPASRIEP